MADASIRAETSRISEEITANRGEMLNLLKRQQEVHTQIKDGAAGQRSVVGDSVNASNVTNIAEAAGNVARHINSGLEKITPAQLFKRVNEKYGLQDGKSSSDSKMLCAAQDWAELGVSLKTTPPMSTMHAALLAAVLKFDMTSYKLIVKHAASRPRLDLKMAVNEPKAKKAKKDPNAPKQPGTGYNLFCEADFTKVRTERARLLVCGHA